MKILLFGVCLVAAIGIIPDKPRPALTRHGLRMIAKDKRNQIKEGMTEAEVRKILGKENLRETSPGFVRNEWRLAGDCEISIVFKGGKAWRIQLFTHWAPGESMPPPLPPKMPKDPPKAPVRK